MTKNRFDFQNLDSASSSRRGELLIATSQLNNSGFERSVILMMQDDQRGSFGVALNKPADDQLITAWEKLTGSAVGDRGTIVSGGPLHGPVFGLHMNRELADIPLPGGLCVSAQVENLQQLIAIDEPYRIVIGVAAWRAGQLNYELEAGLWYVLSAETESIFDETDQMWENCLREFGRRQICDIVGEERLPDDPSLN